MVSQSADQRTPPEDKSSSERWMCSPWTSLVCRSLAGRPLAVCEPMQHGRASWTSSSHGENATAPAKPPSQTSSFTSLVYIFKFRELSSFQIYIFLSRSSGAPLGCASSRRESAHALCPPWTVPASRMDQRVPKFIVEYLKYLRANLQNPMISKRPIWDRRSQLEIVARNRLLGPQCRFNISQFKSTFTSF